MQKFTDTIFDLSGNVVTNASIRITTLAGALATLYSGDGVGSLSNPLSTDSNGAFYFYAPNGHYSAEITVGATLFATRTDIILDDPDDKVKTAILAAPSGAALVGLVPTATLEATTLQGGLTEMDGKKVSVTALAEATGSSLVGHQAGTVGSELVEHQTAIDALIAGTEPIILTSAGASLVGTVPAGGLAGPNVQAALNELDSEKVGVAQLASSTGASLAGENSGYTGENTLTIQDALKYGMVSLRKFGATFDGVTDDTVAIQKAFDSGAPYLIAPSGTTLCGPIFMKSDTVLVMTSKTVFQARAGFGANDRFLNISGVSNVTIHGNRATVKMPKAEYVSGEQRHAVFIVSGTNIIVNDLNGNDSGGDGFYAGAIYGSGNPSRNVVLKNCNTNNNRRQGLSITGVVDMWVIGGVYKNTIGTAPAAGIDVEPDNPLDLIQNVNLIGVKTSGNFGSGILVVPRFAGDAAGTYMSVNIVDCESYNDAYGLGAESSFRFDNGVSPAFKINGVINVRNCRSNLSHTSGIKIGGFSWSNCPELIIDGLTITDCAETAPASTSSACGVDMSTGFATDHIVGVTMRNVIARDTRAVKKMYAPFFIGGASGFQVKDSIIENCDGFGYLLADGPFATFGTTTGLVIRQPAPRVHTFAVGNFSIYRYSGLQLTQSGNGVLTLPLASTCEGLEYEFANTANTQMQISPNAADTIQQFGLAADTDIVLRQTGSTIRLKSMGASGWRVMSLVGHYGPLNFLDSPIEVYGNAAPVTGTWPAGARVINKLGGVGTPGGWKTVAGGSPGTWITQPGVAAAHGAFVGADITALKAELNGLLIKLQAAGSVAT